ncbi:MAG: DoxX family membrane protein, partial [Phycisphaerales bacterium]|nr:DoxX family membrane protein [Phycisphaerales bacterium]
MNERPTAIGWLVFPLRLILGGLFMLAGYLKLSAVPVFAGAILGFKMDLPDHIVIGSAFVVPWVEIIAGAMLVLGFWTRAAAALIGA